MKEILQYDMYTSMFYYAYYPLGGGGGTLPS